MRCIQSLVFVLLVVLSAAPVDAALQVGDRIRFTDQVGTTGGGEFGVHQKNNVNPFSGNTESAELFRTFCIEKNEFIDFNTNGFIIESISQQAVGGGVGGGNPDPISSETAWLYNSFALGTLAGYLGNVASANNLQNAIWGFENEIAQNASWSSNPFVIAANAASPAAKAAALARTFVLNTLWATDRGSYDGVYEGPAPGTLTSGDRAQSMLYVIPEASTIAVWSVLSVLGTGVAYRKKLV